MHKILGVEFAPLWVPIHRRLQTFAILLFASFFMVPMIICLFLIALLFTPLFWITIAYATWYVYDVIIVRASSHGGRRWDWMRKRTIWRHFKDYFPAKLIKTADLEPDRNYMFAYHPHGIIGCGACCTFGSESAGFSEKYPGITPHVLTLKMNFYQPFLRAMLLWMGFCDVSKPSIHWILSKKGGGNAAVIVVGGAEEALHAKPGQHNILLKNRKGFVKQAIRSGAALVPVYGFGENELWWQLDNPEGSTLRSIQNKFKSTLGVSPSIFYGRGIFNYTFGILPRRKPIFIVVGRPIPIEKDPNPSMELIDKIHQQYMDELSELFDRHKTSYGVPEDKKITFV